MVPCPRCPTALCTSSDTRMDIGEFLLQSVFFVYTDKVQIQNPQELKLIIFYFSGDLFSADAVTFFISSSTFCSQIH